MYSVGYDDGVDYVGVEVVLLIGGGEERYDGWWGVVGGGFDEVEVLFEVVCCDFWGWVEGRM